MSDMVGGREFGEGTLSRIVAQVYTFLAIELLFLVTTVPGLIPLVLLDRDASNIPLAALCALPVGPALSAALYALNRRRLDLADLRPAAAFWRGYRMNAGGVLRIWVPLLAWLAIIGWNLAHLGATSMPGWWAVLLVAVAAGATLAGANALVITSLFAFRARDVARLGVYLLARTPGATLATACLLVVAVGVTLLLSEMVVLLLGAVFAAALLHACRPMIEVVRKDFTA